MWFRMTTHLHVFRWCHQLVLDCSLHCDGPLPLPTSSMKIVRNAVCCTTGSATQSQHPTDSLWDHLCVPSGSCPGLDEAVWSCSQWLPPAGHIVNCIHHLKMIINICRQQFTHYTDMSCKSHDVHVNIFEVHNFCRLLFSNILLMQSAIDLKCRSCAIFTVLCSPSGPGLGCDSKASANGTIGQLMSDHTHMGGVWWHQVYVVLKMLQFQRIAKCQNFAPNFHSFLKTLFQ